MEILILVFGVLLGLTEVSDTNKDIRRFPKEVREHLVEVRDELANRGVYINYSLVSEIIVYDTLYDPLPGPKEITDGICDLRTRKVAVRVPIVTSVLLHELGHCVFGLGHGGEPGDIMAAPVSGAMTPERYDEFVSYLRNH